MRRKVVLGAATLLCVLFLATPAIAHTEFESSDPADGANVVEPVDEIEVAFTLPVTVVGSGFEVLDTEGDIVSPEVVTEDDTVFSLLLPEPLVSGDVAVRYEVAAEDGHVLAGGFSFTVSALATTSTVPSVTTTTAELETNSTTESNGSTITSTLLDETTTAAVGADADGGVSWVPLVGGLVLVAGAGIYAWRSLRS